MVIKEVCSLCEETYPYYDLLRCYRCGRLYCRNCVVFSEEGVLCLNCARRMVSPRRGSRGKYSPLNLYLTRRAKYGEYVTLTFKRIEEIIGDNLPPSAFKNKSWWSNTRNRSQSEAWISAGWRVEEVNLNEELVVFRRFREVQAGVEVKRRRTRRTGASLKDLARKRRLRRRRGPSKSRIAMIQARIKNIERRRLQAGRYRGRFR